MATNGAENLDEFFDFARLEQDTHLSLLKSSDGNMSQENIPLDDIQVMDWAIEQTHASLSQSSAASSDMLMETGLDRYPANSGPTLWPLLSLRDQLLLDEDIHDVVPVSSQWSKESALITKNQVQRQPSQRSRLPSSSLLLPDHVPSLLSNRGDAVIRTVASSESSHTQPQQCSEKVSNEEDQVKRQIPLRQASTASWKPASARRKGPQTRIPLEARQILESEYAINNYPLPWEMDIIAHQANLDVKKVRNWFNNTRARQKGVFVPTLQYKTGQDTQTLRPRLSKDSLKVLQNSTQETAQTPQPPLAVYLAQSYQEEAVEISAVQAAIENRSLRRSDDFDDDAWSEAMMGRRGSLITSVASSEGTAPTTYTVSSSGSLSNISSFGRDRRRGRRRMAWKESPYNRQKVNGLNSAGEPQKDLPFFCTFCPRAFKTKYEWVRHEDSVHALRTTWICCDTKQSPMGSCPFCGQAHPDDAHLAAHKYQQCRSKPESQRTFYRRDHFVQHLHHVHFTNAKHPSARVGCQARLMAPEGHNFGCKDLAMTWRRFGAPMKRDDPMLHCGFCGKISKDWSERCEHVAEHLVAREVDRAVWWAERKENHLENLFSAFPFETFRCRYCQMMFADTTSMNAHSHCKVWSCRFLKSADDLAATHYPPPLYPDFPTAKTHTCHLCATEYRTPHAEHASARHRHRSCQQEFYTSKEAFVQHLVAFHNAVPAALQQSDSTLEQNFMRNKGASFEPVEFNESMQPCLMDIDGHPISAITLNNAVISLSSTSSPDHNHTKKSASVRRKSTSHTHPTTTPKARSDPPPSKPEHQGPRFFRLSTFLPSFSSRIFYAWSATKHGNPSSPPLPPPRADGEVLEEIAKGCVAALAMSGGLVGMAGVRWGVGLERIEGGVVELVLDDGEE